MIGSNSFSENKKLKTIIFKGSKPKINVSISNTGESTSIESSYTSFSNNGLFFNPTFGIINDDNSWKDIDNLNDLIIMNNTYYMKSIILVIICLIVLYLITVNIKYTILKIPSYIYALYVIRLLQLSWGKNRLGYMEEFSTYAIILFILNYLLIFLPIYLIIKIFINIIPSIVIVLYIFINIIMNKL
jgi:hypothetical protein